LQRIDLFILLGGRGKERKKRGRERKKKGEIK